MAVHVSIHDVSPRWGREVEEALAACHRHAIRPALLVVPNFHGEAPLDKAPEYAERLRKLQADGHEVYLHGLLHASRRGPSVLGAVERARWHFAQRVVSAGEAEFSDVTQAEAEERLAAGEAMLQAAGLRIDGFVPPAWSMPAWLLPMLGRRGYRFAEDHLRVYDPVAATSRPSVVLNFASRSAGRMASTVAYCRVATVAERLLPARIAIHPGDMRMLLLRREVERLLAWAARRPVVTGQRLVASSR